MSTKNKKIIQANILSEQRYLNNKYLNEDEGTTSGNTQNTKETLQDVGVNLTDSTTHNSILQQLKPYSDKVNINSLTPHVGKDSFFDALGNYVSLSPEKSKIDRSTITGQELKLNLPNGINLKGSFDLKDGGLGSVSIGKNVNIGNQKVNLSLKTNALTGGNTAQVGIKIPIGGKRR
jgi:hypothetical protein